MTQHMLLSAQGFSQSVPVTRPSSEPWLHVFWHNALPPECCSVTCRRSPSRRSPCPCTSRWRGNRWTLGRQSPAACWRPPGGRTTSGPGPWTTRTWWITQTVGAAVWLPLNESLCSLPRPVTAWGLGRSAAKIDINRNRQLLRAFQCWTEQAGPPPPLTVPHLPPARHSSIASFAEPTLISDDMRHCWWLRTRAKLLAELRASWCRV